jgi:hypothetical protein
MSVERCCPSIFSCGVSKFGMEMGLSEIGTSGIYREELLERALRDEVI